MAQRGGRRPGAGRKTKAEELGLPALLDSLISPAQQAAIIRKLAVLACAGNLKAAELYLAYRYGKPPQSLKLSGDGAPVHVVIEYATDTDQDTGAASGPEADQA